MSVKSRGKLNSVPRFSDPDLVSSFKRMSRDIGILRHICSLVANHLLSGDSWLLERSAFATRQSPFHTFYQFVWQAVIRYFRQIQNPALPAQRGGFYASLDPNDDEDHRLRGDLFSEVYGFLASHEDHLESVLSWNTNTVPPGALDIQDEIKLMKTSAVRHVQSFHIRYVSCLEYMIAEILTNTNWKGVRRVASAVKDFVFHPENDDDDDDDDEFLEPELWILLSSASIVEEIGETDAEKVADINDLAKRERRHFRQNLPFLYDEGRIERWSERELVHLIPQHMRISMELERLHFVYKDRQQQQERQQQQPG